MELSEVKKCMKHRKKVRYEDKEYYVSAVTMRLTDNWYYQLELHKFDKNSVIIVAMDKVEMAE